MEENPNIEIANMDLPGDDKLFNIAYWSKTISWVVLVVGILQFILSIFSNYSMIYSVPQAGPEWSINMVFSSIFNSASILVQFFVLQAVGETLYLVIDIKGRLMTEGK